MRELLLGTISGLLCFGAACGGQHLADPTDDGRGEGGDRGAAGEHTEAGATGEGGSSETGRCDAGNGCPYQEGSNITALAADGTKLYWTEHGSIDDLGNFQGDGRLLARAFDSDEVEVLATELDGPVGVALTRAHYYLFLDQLWEQGRREALVRVPRAGGELEVIQLDAGPKGSFGGYCPGCLISSEDTAFFPLEDGVYAVGAEESTPRLLLEELALSLAASGDFLYVEVNLPDQRSPDASEVWKVAITGGDVEVVSRNSAGPLQIAGDFLYAIDRVDAVGDHKEQEGYLARMPLEGGPWTRLPPKWLGYVARLQVSGELFYYEYLSPGASRRELIHGTLDDPSSANWLLRDWASDTTWRIWVGTDAGLFWTDGDRIYRRLSSVE